MLLSTCICPVLKPKSQVGHKIFIVEALLDHHRCNAKGQQSFSPWLNRKPFIGFDTGDGEAGFNLDQLSSTFGVSPPELAVSAERLHRRPVGFKESRPKGEDITGLFEIISRRPVNTL